MIPIWFIDWILMLVITSLATGLVSLWLVILVKNVDQLIVLYFKALQMHENIQDRILERQIAEDKAHLAFRQRLSLPERIEQPYAEKQ